MAIAATNASHAHKLSHSRAREDFRDFPSKITRFSCNYRNVSVSADSLSLAAKGLAAMLGVNTPQRAAG